MHKKLGESYTSELDVLNALKKNWVFRKPQKDYACGYHYQILVPKDGTLYQNTENESEVAMRSF